MKLHFDLLLNDFESLPNQLNAENYIVIEKGVIKKIKFMEPWDEQIIEESLNTPFELIKRLEPYGNKNYEIQFPLPEKWRITPEVTAAVKLNHRQVFLIKFGQGKYWISQKWLYRDLIAGAIGVLVGYILSKITG